MKNSIFALTLLLLVGALSTVRAQEKNFVISTGNPDRVPAIIITANTLAEEHAGDLGEIQIVLYGKAVSNLDQTEPAKAWLDKVKDDKIEFRACNMALHKFDVDQKKLPKQFEVVSNAFIYVLKLKEKGYYGLDL